MEHSNLIEAQLVELKLAWIRASLSRRITEARETSISHAEFLSLVLRDEITNRKNARIERLQRNAGFRIQSSCESLDYTFPRGLEKRAIDLIVICRTHRCGIWKRSLVCRCLIAPHLFVDFV